MDGDGSSQMRLTESWPTPSDRFISNNPDWSPDGVHIAFGTRAGGLAEIGLREIYIMNNDGSGQTNLTNNPAWDVAPAWSPDGTRIAFLSNRTASNLTSPSYEIYVMGIDGSGQTRLTNNRVQNRAGVAGVKVMVIDNHIRDLAPAWSPDGALIAFTSERDGNQEIYVIRADGSDQKRLTTTAADEASPSWSPDGTQIAFTTRRDGNDEIYVMNADGSGQVNVTNNLANDQSPAWGP